MDYAYEDPDSLVLYQCLTKNLDYSFRPSELLHPARPKDFKRVMNDYNLELKREGIKKSIT